MRNSLSLHRTPGEAERSSIRNGFMPDTDTRIFVYEVPRGITGTDAAARIMNRYFFGYRLIFKVVPRESNRGRA
jgi:hypothetical protein